MRLFRDGRIYFSRPSSSTTWRDYVLKTSAEIDENGQTKTYVFTMILQSTTLVRDRLTKAGFDFNDVTGYPKDLSDLILRTISKTGAAIGDLIREFTQIKPSTFSPLTTFNARAQLLKRRIAEADENCAIPDKLATWIILNTIKQTYPDRHRFLVRDIESETLTWGKLMEEMAAEASHEAL